MNHGRERTTVGQGRSAGDVLDLGVVEKQGPALLGEAHQADGLVGVDRAGFVDAPGGPSTPRQKASLAS
ncbi:MAG: hypothetical protein M5U12_04710 [Verrucomicrobia bacterium]|nr:hypothetical protein [Verrucomicrobiota bacterium]